MRPAEPGFYWHWWPGPDEPQVVELLKMHGKDALQVAWCGSEDGEDVSEWSGQFLGPLVPPERPKDA